MDTRRNHAEEGTEEIKVHGRGLLKMVVDLFYSIPLSLSSHFLFIFCSIVTVYVRGKKRGKISRGKLKREEKERGGNREGSL